MANDTDFDARTAPADEVKRREAELLRSIGRDDFNRRVAASVTRTAAVFEREDALAAERVRRVEEAARNRETIDAAREAAREAREKQARVHDYVARKSISIGGR